MKTKFTKGEWKIDTSEAWTVSVVSPWSKDVTTDNFSTFADYRGAIICEMHYNTGVPTKKTAVANAKLIAAAPDLLKLAVDFCSTFESTIGYQKYDVNVFKVLNDRYIQAKSAIKKATE